MRYKSAIGQDSHRFAPDEQSKPLVLGGYTIPDAPGLAGNSDADVILHAITNAISGISGENILGGVADQMCGEGITDSSAYLQAALETLGSWRVDHVSISVEGARPKLFALIPQIKDSIAQLLNLEVQQIGLTATSGEALTDFGKGLGLQAFCIITVCSPDA